MNRYLKYGLILVAVVTVTGLIFYLIKKPNESVLFSVPADASFCISIDKAKFFKELAYFEDIEKDSLFQKIKSGIPADAITIYNTAGLNSLGDLAVFGEINSKLNVAWIGETEKNLKALIRQKKWPEKVYGNFTQVKISDSLYLNYNWPVLVLSTGAAGENFEFFNPAIKKLTYKDLQHPKTKGSIIYGFIITGRNLILKYPFIPLDGKAFVGLKKEDNRTEVTLVQGDVKLQGKLGIPKTQPAAYALLSWPIDMHTLSDIKQIPQVVSKSLNSLVTKPVRNIYIEVLDTVSTIQKIIQYDMDANFQLTQKVIENYKTYPGLRLQFMKSEKDNVANKPTPTNMGLDIFRLHYTETPNSYIIASEDKPPRISEQNIPDYYFYADLNLLKTDPFWEPFCRTSFKKIQLHAEPYGKGSLFMLTLERN